MRSPLTGWLISSRRAWVVPLSALAATLVCLAAAMTPGAAHAASGLARASGFARATGPALIWSAPAQVEKPPFRDRIGVDSVACPSASLCLAGDADGNVLSSVDPTSGSPTWRKTFTGGERAAVQAIVCPNTSFCAAVVDGSPDFFTSTNPGSQSPHWTAATTQVFATGVSCSSAHLCVGVAQRTIMTSTDPAAGASSAWQTAKLSLSSDQVNLTAVSCASAALCVATDSGGDVLVSKNPTGGASAWSVTNVDGQVSLTDMSCPSASFCAALDALGRVEYSATPTGGASAWHRATAPNDASLTAFSCVSASFCTAADGTGNILTTSDPTTGAVGWSSADADGTHAINALTCLSTTLCAAVDQQGDVAVSTSPTGAPSAWTVRNIDGFTLIIGLDCLNRSLCIGGDQAGNIVTSKRPASGPAAWHAANVDGPLGDIDAVSCPSRSLCVAVDATGNVLTSTDPTGGASGWQVASVDGGHWIYSLDCPSTSLCVAGDLSGNILTSTNPTGGHSAWQVTNVDGTNGIYSIACPSVSLCVAGDSPFGGGDNAGILTSANPTGGASAWQPTRFLPADIVGAMSCPTTSFCVGTGQYSFGGGEPRGAIFSSTDPTNSAGWQVINVGDEESALSCASPSLCVAAGGAVLTSTSPASSNPADWQATAGLSGLAVSCPIASFCVADDGAGDIVTGTPPAPTTTTIASVTKSPVVGQQIKVGVRVVNATGGQGDATPAGSVTVSDGARTCVAMLAGSAGVATGHCVLVEPAPGTFSLSASYPGQVPVAGSSTGTGTHVKVGRATSKSTLTLSAGRVKFGHESSERLTVSVHAEFAGVPAGTVIIRSSKKAVCTLTLVHGAASCGLRNKQFPVGTHKLTAYYRGSGAFTGSASATQTLKVVR
jgi:hypothetical protein